MKAVYEIIDMLPARMQEKFKTISIDENETVTLIVLAHIEGINMFKVIEYNHFYDDLNVITLYEEEVKALTKHLIK